MSDSERRELPPPEVTGTFHYQQLIESRLGQPIASDLLDAEVERLAASPGAKLAAGRSAMGWTVEQVAAQLKMSTRQITALEKDDYPALPEAAIVKGFARAYAKLLKLDPAPILALMTAQMEGAGLKSARPGEARRSVQGKTGRPGSNNKPFPLGWILFFCVVAALAYAYFNLPR